MKIFVSGGCKSGKSYYAQQLAKKQQADTTGPLYYIATMQPTDAEDDERISRHRQEREGWGFTTVEQPLHIEKILEKCDFRGSFLLDSLTALLANEMFLPDYNGQPCCHGTSEHAVEKIAEGLQYITASVSNIIIISDSIYCDVPGYDPWTEKYRRFLAQIDQVAAANCDVVLEIVWTNVIVHKGKEVFKTL